MTGRIALFFAMPLGVLLIIALAGMPSAVRAAGCSQELRTRSSSCAECPIAGAASTSLPKLSDMVVCASCLHGSSLPL